MPRPVFFLALIGALAACAPVHGPRPTAIIEKPPTGESWREAAAVEDATTIDGFAARWTRALAVPPRARRAVVAEGALLDPAATLDHPALSPGSYNCRVVRIEGGRVTGFPQQFCFVRGESDGRLSFNKQTGSDLPNGWLYPDGDARYIFLGAQQRRAGENSLAYGSDRARDRIGIVDRIGPFRWRLAMPREGGALWVYELTPVPIERQPG